MTSERNLSKKYGGSVERIKVKGREVKLKTYCRMFYKRPKDIEERFLCTGMHEYEKLFPSCVDFMKCLRQVAGSGAEKKPYDRGVPPRRKIVTREMAILTCSRVKEDSLSDTDE